MLRYTLFVFTLLAVSFSSASQDQHPQSLEELTLAQTQNRLKQGSLTLEQLRDYYLSQIEQHDNRNNGLNAVVAINPMLSGRIAQLQYKLHSGNKLGRLFGAFVLVKDNIDIKGMANTAGAYVMRDHTPTDDAYIVARLRAEDAIILGKTNLSEWANFRSSFSSSGYSTLFGQTRNPYDLSRSPCGSSSGSGAAIAADFALFAVGTETDGSVTCPSALNGLVGIKPTIGLLSRDGIIPISHSQDTAGPMARTVTDAVLLLESMMGKDPSDPAGRNPVALQKHLSADGLKNKRIGIVRNLMGYHPGLDAVFESQLAILKSQGAVLVDDLSLAHKGDWGDPEYQVLLSEFKVGLNAYFEQSKAPIKDLQQLIETNQATAEISLHLFDQAILVAAQATGGLQEEVYIKSRQDSVRFAAELGIDALLKAHNLDLLIAPTESPAWKIDQINGDNYLGGASSAPAIAGYPHITVPMGFVKHLPVGISFFSTANAESVLVEAAYAYEQASMARKSPTLTRRSEP